MTTNSGQIIRETLDAAFGAEGFKRMKSVWTRPRDGFVDVIEFQTSKFASEFTLNVGIYKSDIYQELYCSLPKSLSAASCIIEKRAGALANNDLDYWWPLHDPNTPREIVSCAKEHVVPFLDSHHSFNAMIDFLEHKKVQKYNHFPGSYYLALLYFKMNRRVDGCELLQKLQQAGIKVLGDSYGSSKPSVAESRLIRLLNEYGCTLN
jgi:Domain of unknown function (DUF4304)